MSTRGLALVFLVALATLLALLVPLRLVLDATGSVAPGLSARGVTGPVWSGRLQGAELGRRPLGDVTVALAPLPLLAGVQRVHVAGAEASADLLRGRRAGIAHANGRVELGGLAMLPGLVVVLRPQDAGLQFAKGRCVRADGVVAVEVGIAGAGGSVRLHGPMRCDGDHGVLALASSPGAGHHQAQATLELGADGSYRLRSLVRPGDAATALVLQAAGFRQTPAGLARADSGQLPH